MFWREFYYIRTHWHILREVYLPCCYHCTTTSSYNYLLDIPSDNHFNTLFIIVWMMIYFFPRQCEKVYCHDLQHDLQKKKKKRNGFIGVTRFIETYMNVFLFCTSELMLIMGILFFFFSWMLLLFLLPKNSHSGNLVDKPPYCRAFLHSF